VLDVCLEFDAAPACWQVLVLDAVGVEVLIGGVAVGVVALDGNDG